MRFVPLLMCFTLGYASHAVERTKDVGTPLRNAGVAPRTFRAISMALFRSDSLEIHTLEEVQVVTEAEFLGFANLGHTSLREVTKQFKRDHLRFNLLGFLGFDPGNRLRAYRAGVRTTADVAIHYAELSALPLTPIERENLTGLAAVASALIPGQSTAQVNQPLAQAESDKFWVDELLDSKFAFNSDVQRILRQVDSYWREGRHEPKDLTVRELSIFEERELREYIGLRETDIGALDGLLEAGGLSFGSMELASLSPATRLSLHRLGVRHRSDLHRFSKEMAKLPNLHPKERRYMEAIARSSLSESGSSQANVLMGATATTVAAASDAQPSFNLRIDTGALFSTRTTSCLIHQMNSYYGVGVNEVGELRLLKEDDLLRLPTCGAKTVDEIKTFLLKNGLSLDSSELNTFTVRNRFELYHLGVRKLADITGIWERINVLEFSAHERTLLAPWAPANVRRPVPSTARTEAELALDQILRGLATLESFDLNVDGPLPIARTAFNREQLERIQSRLHVIQSCADVLEE